MGDGASSYKTIEGARSPRSSRRRAASSAISLMSKPKRRRWRFSTRCGASIAWRVTTCTRTCCVRAVRVLWDACATRRRGARQNGRAAHPRGRAACGLTDVAVVVTRYFGGVLLGTGGLVRAYTQATQAAVEAARIVVVSRCVDIVFEVPYALLRADRPHRAGVRGPHARCGFRRRGSHDVEDARRHAGCVADRDDRADSRSMRADGERARRSGVLARLLLAVPCSRRSACGLRHILVCKYLKLRIILVRLRRIKTRGGAS